MADALVFQLWARRKERNLGDGGAPILPQQDYNKWPSTA